MKIQDRGPHARGLEFECKTESVCFNLFKYQPSPFSIVSMQTSLKFKLKILKYLDI